MSKWEAKVAEKRAACAAAIPKAWRLPSAIFDLLKLPLETNKNDLVALDIPRKSGILSTAELAITEKYTVPELLKALADGTLSSLEVTTAFSKRAAIAQQLTGCLTEMFFDQAQERAKTLDAMRSNGRLAGPLHGLPISVKDSFQIAGIPTTIGMRAFLDDPPAARNSPLIDILLGLGAVLYVKTNVPQTLMAGDSHNYVFGRALNPWNTLLTPGGSSGGEGALAALRGAPLGVGTDIAGSIRIPALCCGTYGFKPTTSRIPYGSQRSCADPGLRVVLAAAGPISYDIDAVELFVQAVIAAEPARLDATALDVPWREAVARGGQHGGRRLRLGVLAEDPLFPLQPPVRKALRDACARLAAQGHELVPLTAAEGHVADASEVLWKTFDLDPTAGTIVEAGGESWIPAIVRIEEQWRQMAWDFVPDATGAGTGPLGRLSVLTRKRAEIAADWLRLWREHQLDAVVGPAAQNTAVEHDLYALSPYTAFLNLLDYPASVLPFGKAGLSSETYELPKGTGGAPYHPETLEGAPCSVQVFTSRMRDEECVAIAKIVDTCLNGGQAHPV